MTPTEQLIEYTSLNPNTYARYLAKSKPDLYALVENSFGRTVPEKVFNFLNPDVRASCMTCKTCNKTTDEFITLVKGYRVYCSSKCASNDPDPAIKAKMMRGTRSNESKQKRKETLIDRYGTDSMISVNRGKAIETNQAKYGVDYPFQNKGIRERGHLTVFEKYGVSNVFQIASVKQKIKDTIFKHHGITSPGELKPAERAARVIAEHDYQITLLREQIALLNDKDLLREFVQECYFKTKSAFKIFLSSRYPMVIEAIEQLPGESWDEKIYRLL